MSLLPTDLTLFPLHLFGWAAASRRVDPIPDAPFVFASRHCHSLSAQSIGRTAERTEGEEEDRGRERSRRGECGLLLHESTNDSRIQPDHSDGRRTGSVWSLLSVLRCACHRSESAVELLSLILICMLHLCTAVRPRTATSAAAAAAAAMWFVLQAALGGLLVVFALAVSWFVVWRLILSKFPLFQEIMGIRPSLAQLTAGVSGAPGSIQTAEQAAAIKRKKQKEANTFVLTRSGEQMAQLRRRESLRHAALVQAAAQGRMGHAQPTTTPGSSTPTAVPATPSAMGAATPMGSATPALQHALYASGQRPRAASGAAAAAAAAAATAATNASLAPPSLSAHPSALPTSNHDAAAIAAEALLRRKHAAQPTDGSATPSAQPSQQTATPPVPVATATIGGAGWLQRAAIIEDYQPSRNK